MVPDMDIPQPLTDFLALDEVQASYPHLKESASEGKVGFPLPPDLERDVFHLFHLFPSVSCSPEDKRVITEWANEALESHEKALHRKKMGLADNIGSVLGMAGSASSPSHSPSADLHAFSPGDTTDVEMHCDFDPDLKSASLFSPVLPEPTLTGSTVLNLQYIIQQAVNAATLPLQAELFSLKAEVAELRKDQKLRRTQMTNAVMHHRGLPLLPVGSVQPALTRPDYVFHLTDEQLQQRLDNLGAPVPIKDRQTLRMLLQAHLGVAVSELRGMS